MQKTDIYNPSKEFKYLINVAKYFISNDSITKPTIGALNQEVLADLIRVHKMQAVMSSCIPPIESPLSIKEKRKLISLTHWQKKRKFLLMASLIGILQAHAKEQITVVPYKGLTIGTQFYESVFHRDFNDIDFAIQRKDLKQSAVIMQALGYEEYRGPSNYTNLEKSRSYHIDYSWVKRDVHGKIIVNAEMHWQPANSALYTPCSFDSFVDKRTTISLLSKDVTAFKPVYNALYMVIHHGLVDGWMCLRHLVDFALALRKLSREEQDELLVLVVTNKIRRCFFIGLYIAESLFDCHLLKIGVEKKSKIRSKNIFLKAFLKSNLVGKWSDNKSRLYYYLLMRDSLGDGLRSGLQFSRFAIKDYTWSK